MTDIPNLADPFPPLNEWLDAIDLRVAVTYGRAMTPLERARLAELHPHLETNWKTMQEVSERLRITIEEVKAARETGDVKALVAKLNG